MILLEHEDSTKLVCALCGLPIIPGHSYYLMEETGAIYCTFCVEHDEYE